MSMDRRNFLKIAGFSTIVGGLGSGLTLGALNSPKAEASSGHGSSKAGRDTTWAMVVDPSKFRGAEDYQKCIKACHTTHNVPQFNNPKDEVKWIWTETFEHTFTEQGHEYMPEELERLPFMLLCNHCENPACVRVCPTKATFKRKSDGIVIQDMHRCIGCRFCMAACPFGARSFNWKDPRPHIAKNNPDYPTRTIGVVEKCTFCVERLAEGLAPACVEAAKEHGGLVFGNLEDPHSEVREIMRTKYTIQRKPQAGTAPRVFYVIGG